MRASPLFDADRLLFSYPFIESYTLLASSPRDGATVPTRHHLTTIAFVKQTVKIGSFFYFLKNLRSLPKKAVFWRFASLYFLGCFLFVLWMFATLFVFRMFDLLYVHRVPD